MEIYKKLLKAQSGMPCFKKDAENKFFKSNYLTLPALLKEALPILQDNNILFFTQVISKDDKNYLEVKLLEAETGSFIASLVPLIGITDMQKFGMACTYAMRYGLLGLLGLAPEVDDDGEELVRPKELPKTKIADKIKNLDKPKIINEIKTIFKNQLDKYPDKKLQLENAIQNDFAEWDNAKLVNTHLYLTTFKG